MKEENTNLETTQTTEPQMEMPTPVDQTTTSTQAPESISPAPVEMPAPVENTVAPAPVDIPSPVIDQTSAPTEGPAPAQGNGVIASPDLGSASMSNLAPVTEGMNDNNQSTTDGPSAAEIAQGIENGTYVNAVTDPNAMIGAKVGNSADDTNEINKKKSKKNITFLVVVLVILATIGGVGYYVYNYEYKSANKRIDSMFTKMNNFVLPLISDVEKRMGDYEVEASATEGSENKAEIHLSGNYAYNLEDYIYFDTKIDKVYLNQDMLEKTPIEGNVYITDDTIYFKIEELFPKYIKRDYPGISDIMNSIKQNDIDYTVYYSAIMNALKSSIKNYATSQTVGSTSISGKNQQANIVTISVNKNNYNAFAQNFISVLTENDEFMTNIAKFFGTDKETMVKGFRKSSENDFKFDGEIKINIYSPLFGDKILGIDATIVEDENTYKTTFVPVGNDEWKVTAYKNGEKATDFTLGFKSTQVSGKKSYVTSYKGEFTYEDEDDKTHVVQAEVKFTYNINVQFQDDKPVTRDAVKIESLTEDDYATINENINSKYGMLGTYLTDILEELLTPPTSDYEDELEELCSQATSCNCSGTSCSCTVNYEGYDFTITCPAN